MLLQSRRDTRFSRSTRGSCSDLRELCGELTPSRRASDARSGAVVDDRIRPALESGAAIGSSKPVLVIIDEIDGATGAGDNVRLVGCSDLVLCGS